MYSSDNTGGASSRSRPVTPLPNPGEGGPIPPIANTPGSLLPSPGEMPSQPGAGTPVAPLPNPGEGGPVVPNRPSTGTPVVPLPNPGEGGPVTPGRPGVVIPVRPQPNPPCYYCTSAKPGQIRFLNAAIGYSPFRIYVNNYVIVNGLGFASLTPYGRVAGGYQTVTVAGMNGYIYLQKSMPIRSDETATIAIINTASGLDLLQISDVGCSRPKNMACLRVCNLAPNVNPLDVILSDGRVVFSDVRFKEVTDYRRARPGQYEFYLAETNLRPMPRFEDIETINTAGVIFEMPTSLVSFFVNVTANANYTIYILSTSATPDAIQILVIEDR